MRHCKNESIEVYESRGDNLAELLREAAVQVEETNNSYHNLDIHYQCEEAVYLVTLYVHS